jgi:hypothetical protein
MPNFHWSAPVNIYIVRHSIDYIKKLSRIYLRFIFKYVFSTSLIIIDKKLPEDGRNKWPKYSKNNKQTAVF